MLNLKTCPTTFLESKRAARAICAVMKLFPTLLLALGLLFCAAPAKAVLINGRNYTALSEWRAGTAYTVTRATTVTRSS
ncbi:MAG: hypothetical protein WDN00_14200 [Limisphaerales bacterium]